MSNWVYPQAMKSTSDKVDVLIVGSGASGAAVAWSLADTRMRIVCLEQGERLVPLLALSRPTAVTGRHAATPTSISVRTAGVAIQTIR